MLSVKKFNGLNGKVISRSAIFQLAAQANHEEQFHLEKRLKAVLDKYDYDTFTLEVDSETIEAAPKSLLDCLDCIENEKTEIGLHGLSKAVSANDIYQMITDKFISVLEQPLDFTQEWGSHKNTKGGYLVPYNFDSKKQYRGINFMMLASMKLYDPSAPLLENPYYLTFKQIEDRKGKVKKGTHGHQVIYFTNLYKITIADKNIDFGSYDYEKVKNYAIDHGIDLNFIDTIPILKYYIVFNGADVEGIDFDLANFKGKGKVAPQKKYVNKDLKPIPIAEAIIKAYPKPAPKIKYTGSDAFYNRLGDFIQVPKLQQFKYEQAYYTTLFHELIHSTGAKKRLDRVKGKKFGDKDYSFEELIAEIGASFLSSEAGILHYTFRNSAAYIKSWRKVLLSHMKEDNKFFFRAASQAQKAVDFMLDRDANGIAAYEKIKVTEVAEKPVIKPNPSVKKVTATKAKKAAVKVIVKKDLDAINAKPFEKKPKSVSVATAIKDILNLPKYKGISFLIASILFKHFKNDDGTDLELPIDITSDYENGILQKKTVLHNYSKYSQELELTGKGILFIQSVKGRLESLRNQKTNYALFPLNGKKKSNKGMKAPVMKKPTTIVETDIKKEPVINKPTVTQPVLNQKSLAYMLQNKDNENHEYYIIDDAEIAAFLGQIEKKKKQSVAITLAGGEGSGKTRACFRFMNALAQNYKVGHASIEEHPKSALYKNKIDEYLNEKALHNIEAPEINSIDDVHELVKNNDIIIIDSFSKLQELSKGCKLDKDFRQAYDGKLFIIIYQLTSDGKMRGGSSSQFDGDIILFSEVFPDYRENYIFPSKNRYHTTPLNELKYNVFRGEMVKEPAKEIVETKEPLKLSFKISKA